MYVIDTSGYLCYRYFDCWEIATGRVENGWLCIRSIYQIIIKLTALMRAHQFSTLPVAISTNVGEIHAIV